MGLIKYWIKRLFSYWLYRKQVAPAAFRRLIAQIPNEELSTPFSAEADLFTYHGEDGTIQFLIRHLKNLPPVFIDIGAGDCIKGNCTTLAVHMGWTGLFIDAKNDNLEIGKHFYKKINKQHVQFRQAYVTPENANALLERAGITGEVGLLSIDIDGNDYWIWKSMSVIRPRILVIEVKVEFGNKNIVVPYSETNNRDKHREYNGCSVEAMKKLSASKGYRLVAANRQGYNLFFIREEDVSYPFKEWNTSEILQDPETIQSFYPQGFFKKNDFIEG